MFLQKGLAYTLYLFILAQTELPDFLLTWKADTFPINSFSA